MTGEEIDAIVGGYHGDVFRILGPHSVRKKHGQARWVVRAFLPQAESAAVTTANGRVEMAKLHPQGFFEAALEGGLGDYKIAIHPWNGSEVEVDDPYRH